MWNYDWKKNYSTTEQNLTAVFIVYAARCVCVCVCFNMKLCIIYYRQRAHTLLSTVTDHDVVYV